MADDREQQLLDTVLKRATVDRAFRQALQVKPHGAIAQALGIRIPAQYRVRFIERDPDIDALIVLPDFDPAAEAESETLSDEDLEQIAGGTDGDRTWSE